MIFPTATGPAFCRVRWFFVPEDTPFIPFLNPYGSSNWRLTGDDADLPYGEIRTRHRSYYKGVRPAGWQVGGPLPDGPLEAWQGLPGEWAPIARGQDGFPLLCQPPGLLGIGGNALTGPPGEHYLTGNAYKFG